MEQLRLINYGDTLASTAKGREFVSEYRKVLQILRRFGLAE
jgi:hypothetical protein